MAPDVIETQRLVLRPLAQDDTGMIAMYLGDERLARMLWAVPHPYPPGSAAALVDWANSDRNDGQCWAIGHRTSQGELVGSVLLKGDGEIAYWVGAPFQNSGFATEAVEAVIAHAFAGDATRLTARVFQDNPASAAVLTKAGFEFVGEGAGFSMARGAEAPEWHYRLERGTWVQQQSLRQSA